MIPFSVLFVKVISKKTDFYRYLTQFCQKNKVNIRKFFSNVHPILFSGPGGN